MKVNHLLLDPSNSLIISDKKQVGCTNFSIGLLVQLQNALSRKPRKGGRILGKKDFSYFQISWAILFCPPLFSPGKNGSAEILQKSYSSFALQKYSLMNEFPQIFRIKFFHVHHLLTKRTTLLVSKMDLSTKKRWTLCSYTDSNTNRNNFISYFGPFYCQGIHSPVVFEMMIRHIYIYECVVR